MGPFCRIQDGIDAASGGNEVVVALGEYSEDIDFNGKAITLRSTAPMVPGTILGTIINGSGTRSVITCDSGEGPDTVLSGFLMTNGNSGDGGDSNCAATHARAGAARGFAWAED